MTSRSKVLLLIIVVAILAIAVFVYRGSVGPATSADGTSALLEYIPGDTPFVALGHSTSEAASEQLDLWLGSVELSDVEPYLDILRTETEHPSAALLAWFIEDYLVTGKESGYDGLLARYGLDPEGAYGFYMHGAVPVFRIELNAQDALRATLDEAEAESGVSHRDPALGEAWARAWPLANEGDLGDSAPELELGLVVEDNWLTVSLLTDRDAADARLERFARLPAADSLAESDILDRWRGEFARSDLMFGYLDFHRLAEAFLLPEQNSTGRELVTLFPDFNVDRDDNLSDVCRQEFVELTRGAPRTVFGSTAYEVSEEQITMGLRYLLSIENAAISEQLQRLPGFLPDYSRNLDDKMLALAMGVDMDAVVPALTALWRQFMDAPFECDKLQQAQQTANSANPMMMSMFTAMARGLKGAGIAIYDFYPDSTSAAGIGGTVLVSISAEDPSALVSLLTSYAPGMAGTRVPEDGTPVALNVPGAPADVYIAIKGKHIVIYRGDKAEQEAEKLADEPLEANGTVAMALNLRTATDSLVGSPETVAAMAPDNCQETYIGMLHMAQSPFELSYHETFNELGWDAELDMTMSLKATAEVELPGSYTMSVLGDGCQWSTVGIEQMSDDGEGHYQSMDEAEACALVESDYHWEKTGNRIEQVTQSQRSREECDGEWNEQVPEDFSCNIVHSDDQGFYCLWQEDLEMELYRYQQR